VRLPPLPTSHYLNDDPAPYKSYPLPSPTLSPFIVFSLPFLFLLITAGEYDPGRAEAELARRLDARQDIKAAHKACLHASNGNMDPLKELFDTSISQGSDSTSRLILVEAISQATKEVVAFISASLPILTAISSWINEAIDDSTRGLGGAWVVTESHSLIAAAAAMLPKMPAPLSRAQQEAVRSSGLALCIRRLATESRPSPVKDAALYWSQKWDAEYGKGSSEAPSLNPQPSSSKPKAPPRQPSSGGGQQSHGSFLTSLLQPLPSSSIKQQLPGGGASGSGKLSSSAAGGGIQRTAPVVAPMAGTALSELQVSLGLSSLFALCCLTVIICLCLISCLLSDEEEGC
jgi:hypothetical protein